GQRHRLVPGGPCAQRRARPPGPPPGQVRLRDRHRRRPLRVALPADPVEGAMNELQRRDGLAGTLWAGVGLTAASAARAETPAAAHAGRQMIAAADFGAVGDGRADDTAALQRALETAIRERRGGLLVIPPGDYRVTRTLRIETENKPRGNIPRACLVQGRGARLISEIEDGTPVVEVTSHAVVRFLTIEGLEIQGNRKEGHGLSLNCLERGTYLYNFCLRDLVVQNCGGDGCSLI